MSTIDGSTTCAALRRLTITVAYGPLDATFTGYWREDGGFSGGWRPSPGADETVNVPYVIGGHRLA